MRRKRAYQMQCCDWSGWSRRCHWGRKWLGWTAGCKRTGRPGSCGLSRWWTEKTELYWIEPGAAAVGNKNKGRRLVCTPHKHSLRHFIFTMQGSNISRNYSKLDSDLKYTEHLVFHLLWEYNNHWKLLEVMPRSCEARMLDCFLHTALQLTRRDILQAGEKKSNNLALH